jgi:hypothetical protein
LQAAPVDARDARTCMAIDVETKLVPSWRIGDHSSETAITFVGDLAKRLVSRARITTDGHRAYLKEIEGASVATLTTPCSSRFTACPQRARSATARLNASVRSGGNPDPNTSARRLWSAKISRCECRCGASRG